MKYLLIALFIFCNPLLAAPVEIDLDGYYHLTTGAGFQPPQNSLVTYKLGDKLLHHDGYIYENGERTERQWSILSPEVVDMYHKHQQLAEEWGSEVVVNLNSESPHVSVTDYPNQSIKVDISSSQWRRARAQGYTMSPGPNQVTFTHKGYEYRPDGKVYKDGKATGESWGVPFVGEMPGEGGVGKAIEGFLNGAGGEVTGQIYKTIVTYKQFLVEKKEWDNYISQRRKQASQELNQVVNYNDSYADAISGHKQAIGDHTKNMVEELDEHLGQLTGYIKEDSTVLNIEPTLPEDFEFAHVNYHYQDERFENLVANSRLAVDRRDYERLRKIIDLTVNSEYGLPDELKDFTSGGKILLPEKIDPSLGASPLADTDPSWDQSTHLGQVATRTANKLQSSWARQDGLKYSPTETALKHLASYSLFQKGVELMPWSNHDSLLFFKLSSMVLDMGVGAGVGFYQSLEGLVKSVPGMVEGGADFIYKSATEEGYLEETYSHFIENIPAIKQAIWQGILESWDTVNNGTPYEKGKLIGGLALDSAVTYATGGAAGLAKGGITGANWYQKSSMATRKLYDSLRGVRRSPKWLASQSRHFDQVEHWVDYVDTNTIEFHSPAHPKAGPLDDKFMTADIKFDERGVPLPGQRLAETFNAGTYMSYVTKEPIQLFRVFSDDGAMKGRFLTDVPPGGPAQAIADLALHPAYKNQALKWAVIEVPPGTKVFEGNVAPQIGVKYEIKDAQGRVTEIIGMENLKGMGRQYYIDSDLRNLEVKHYGDF